MRLILHIFKMTAALVKTLLSSNDNPWEQAMHSWHYAMSPPGITAALKHRAQDFRVVELMQHEPAGEGEHWWLWIEKECQHTDGVAKALAKFAAVAYRDVGYSGLKDFKAVTQQWFSVWKPKGSPPDWSTFAMPGVSILKAQRHTRKIKRSTHFANAFVIRLCDLSESNSELVDRLSIMQAKGVPNYFGTQRFGRGAGNVQQFLALFDGKHTPKLPRNKRSMLISAARSWLFNSYLSARIASNTWDTAQAGDWLNLDGSQSIFRANGDEAARLATLDVHPTGPLWGTLAEDQVLSQAELETQQRYPEIASELEGLGLKLQRRPLRCKVSDLSWNVGQTSLELSFSLLAGQYATTVLRELVQTHE